MLKKINIFLLLMIPLFPINSQAQKKSFEELKKMSRKNLIQLAVKYIKNDPLVEDASSFNLKNFDRISVHICDADEANKRVWVSFDMSYKFIPLDSSYYYSFLVDLNGEGISSTRLLFNNNNNIYTRPTTIEKFFNFTQECNQAIQFVINSTNKSKAVEHIPNGKLRQEYTMFIYEKENYYEIHVESEYGKNYYKIEKINGRIYDIMSDTNAEPLISKETSKCYEKK